MRLALAGVGILLLLALNYLYFREKTSSNSELITRYTRKADPMEKYRNPAVAGLFYAAAPQTLDREVSGYLQAPAALTKNAEDADRAACRLSIFGAGGGTRLSSAEGSVRTD